MRMVEMLDKTLDMVTQAEAERDEALAKAADCDERMSDLCNHAWGAVYPNDPTTWEYPGQAVNHLVAYIGELRAQLAAEQAAHEAALAAEAQLVEKLETEQAAHKLDLEVFESGANVMRTRMLEAEALRDSALARLGEVVDAVKAERQSVRDYNTASRTKEWKAAWDAMLAACALTDAMVAKHAGAGVDEPITSEALEREGWELVDVDKSTRQLVLSRDLEWRSLTWFNDGSITVEHDGAVILVPNCFTMRDINTLVRLFTKTDTTN